MTAPVQVYVSRYCGWCTRALALLEAKGAAPEVISVDSDRELRGEKELRSGRRTVPQIFIGDRHVGGFDDLRALETAGQLDAMLREEQAAAS
ncbi:MAG TPA: glutaredoxin 3 [Gammaproteobacteria bacterium]|nr:glutaredoxin 3 [Gammaproteobacteria bacterium]